MSSALRASTCNIMVSGLPHASKLTLTVSLIEHSNWFAQNYVGEKAMNKQDSLSKNSQAN